MDSRTETIEHSGTFRLPSTLVRLFLSLFSVLALAAGAGQGTLPVTATSRVGADSEPIAAGSDR